MLYADATKGVGGYFVGSPRYMRELSVANPIYRSRSNVGAAVPARFQAARCGAVPLINTILTKSQRRCINHGYVETVAPSEEICGCAITRAMVCRTASVPGAWNVFKVIANKELHGRPSLQGFRSARKNSRCLWIASVYRIVRLSFCPFPLDFGVDYP